MRYTRVKTTIFFETPAGHFSQIICCHHDNEIGNFVFCDEKGKLIELVGRSKDHITKIIDAINLLTFQIEEGRLKEGVEFCENPWETNHSICPECGSYTVEKWSGIKCTKCEYWECF